MIRTHEAGRLRATDVGTAVVLAGWVASRRDHGGVVFIDLRDASGVVQCVLREGTGGELRNEFCLRVVGEVSAPARRQREPRPGDRRRRGDRQLVRHPLHQRRAAVPARRARSRRQRGAAAAVPLSRHAPRAGRRRDQAAVAHHRRRAAGDGRARLHRRRDPVPDPLDTRRRPRLPGARAAAARQLVRASAVAAAVQAAAHGRRARALLPVRPVLPRRGLPRRPPARIHPARHRDVVLRAGRRHRSRRRRS